MASPERILVGVGRIVQVSISAGGVPKRRVRTAEVAANGLAGDQQKHTDIHGGPGRAVCLYSLERIEALRTEGHPVEPGALGENVTLAGLAWEHVVPGCHFHLGKGVVLEVTQYTIPCKTIAGSFVDRNFSRVLDKKYPGWSRVYGRVLSGGTISEGDRAELHLPVDSVIRR